MGVLGSVEALGPWLREQRGAIEEARRLPAAVVDALRDAGVFGMTFARALGGPELDPLEQLQVIEAVAAGDASAGWCSMINSDGGYMTAFLEPAVAREMYPRLDMPTAAIANPAGSRAVRTAGGYDVSGRWSFASGCTHSEWFFLNALLFDGDALVLDGTGLPGMRVLPVPRADVEIVDNWYTTGLAGSASNDITVAGTFVPEERSFSLLDGPAVQPGPLYALRWMFFLNMGAVPLGAAREALCLLGELAQTKVTMPAFALLREEALVQLAVARGETLVRSARAYLFECLGQLWDGLCAGNQPTPKEFAYVRLATTNAFTAAKEAVTMAYEAAGSSALYRPSPFDRLLRDVTTMSQHVIAQQKTYLGAGRVLLGLEAGQMAFL